jgi:hypothetical protein
MFGKREIKDFNDPVEEYNYWMKKMARETAIALKLSVVTSTILLFIVIAQLVSVLLRIK